MWIKKNNLILNSIISRTNTEQLNKIHQDSQEDNWSEEEDKLVQIIQYGARIAIQEGLIQPEESMKSFLLSGKKIIGLDLAKYRFAKFTNILSFKQNNLRQILKFLIIKCIFIVVILFGHIFVTNAKEFIESVKLIYNHGSVQ